MNFLVFGAGAVGGIVAARLARHHPVAVVARGAHLAAIRAGGLTVHTPAGTEVVALRASDTPVVDAGTIVLLAVKTQDAAGALRELAAAAPAPTPIVCLTNGIDAERQALRWFDHVYGMCVNMPAAFVEPGVVESRGTPVPGLFDIGCYPEGGDARCDAIASALEAVGLSSRAYPDIMRWKRGKLVFNLSNALDALCGRAGRTSALADDLYEEARRCFAAAGLAITSDEEVAERYRAFQTIPIAGRATRGGSTWQSLARGARVLECEYLNGEIALLGRMHGVPAPLNDAVLRYVTAAATAGVTPGALSLDELERTIRRMAAPPAPRA